MSKATTRLQLEYEGDWEIVESRAVDDRRHLVIEVRNGADVVSIDSEHFAGASRRRVLARLVCDSLNAELEKIRTYAAVVSRMDT